MWDYQAVRLWAAKYVLKFMIAEQPVEAWIRDGAGFSACIASLSVCEFEAAMTSLAGRRSSGRSIPSSRC